MRVRKKKLDKSKGCGKINITLPNQEEAMKMLRINQVLICSVVFLALIIYNTSPALTFDFEKADQIKQWQDLAGTMEIRDGLFCSVNAAGGPLVSIIKEWNDEWQEYTLTVKAEGLIGDADWGLAFRVKDATNHYSWQFCNGNLMFVVYVGGRTETAVVAQAEKLNEWQDFKVDVKGNSFDCYFNGALIKTIKHDALKTGSVGTFNWINGGLVVGKQGGVAFDDFTVEGKGIPSSTAVDPQSKLAVTWAELKK
jgi:hypothetical protein